MPDAEMLAKYGTHRRVRVVSRDGISCCVG